MSSIPLHCSICPKAPDFSDVSHLLTHIASKGHLSHYFRAQVRARQDAGIREKINAFDLWYDQNHIEKLLSQRMSAKHDQRTGNDRTTAKSKQPAKPAKSTKAGGRAKREVPKESIIDTQLAPRPTPPSHHSRNQESPSEAPLKGHAPIPRMLAQGTEANTYAKGSRSFTPGRGIGRGSDRSLALDTIDSGCGQSSPIRTPTKQIYPDPADMPSYMEKPTQPTNLVDEEEAPGCNITLLKGMIYPGMSLFDAATHEAQRLRNQKKNESVLEQMEHDSTTIEPTERIFWPGGEVKLERVITGNVESSPFKESTPPPKRPRRARPKNKNVLADISTNASRPGKKRQQKPPPTQTVGKVTPQAIENMTKIALKTLRAVYPQNTHISYAAPISKEQNLTQLEGSPRHRRSPDFAVFRDTSSVGKKSSISDGASDGKSSPFQRFTSQIDSQQTCPTQLDFGEDHEVQDFLSGFSDPERQSIAVAYFQRSSFEDNKENIEVPTHHTTNELFEDDVGESQPRATQRYFSAIGNQPPQFFSSLPPHMEFGGFVGPIFHGSYLNPLSTTHADGYQQPQFSPGITRTTEHGNSPKQSRTAAGLHHKDRVSSKRRT